MMDTMQPDPDGFARKVEAEGSQVDNNEPDARRYRRARDFAENLIETAHAIVLTMDLQAYITRFNRAAEVMTGWSKEEVLGKNWFDVFIPPEGREEIRGVFADVVNRGGEVSSYENPILTRNGDRRIINWSNNIIRAEEGEPVGVLSIGVDVTERVIAERELRTAKERLQEEGEALSQKNIALSQILEHIEREREKYRDEVTGNIESLLLPIVEKLRKNGGWLSTREVDHLEDALQSLVGKEVDVYQRNLARLTGRELQVGDMIRKGLPSKEIADRLGVSLETVSKHRESIRRKLEVRHSSVDLTTYLKSRPWFHRDTT